MLFISHKKNDGTIELQEGIMVNKSLTAHCLFMYACELLDRDDFIKRKWISFEKDSKENPDEKITFINNKTHKAFIAYGGHITEIDYKKDDGSIPTDTIIAALRKLLIPKEELRMLQALNGYLKGEDSWDIVYQQEKLRVEKEIERDDMGHLPLHDYNIEQGRGLYNFLLEHKFISEQTSVDNFLYILGFSDEKPITPCSIHWIRTKELLSILLFDLLYERQIKNKRIRKSDLEKRVPDCFIYKKGGKMDLAKRRTEESPYGDLLRNYFSTNF